MEVNATLQSSFAPRNPTSGGASGAARSEALAENRRTQTQDHIQRAETSRANASDQLAELREAVARVVGANTRLSIAKAEQGAEFIYKAIDVDTGEIVSEWPQQIFIALVRGVREDVRADVDAGLILDHVA